MRKFGPRLLAENYLADTHLVENNLADRHLVENNLVDSYNCKEIVVPWTVDQMTVPPNIFKDKHGVGQMPVGLMSVGQVLFDEKAWSHKDDCLDEASEATMMNKTAFSCCSLIQFEPQRIWDNLVFILGWKNFFNLYFWWPNYFENNTFVARLRIRNQLELHWLWNN